MHWSNTITKLFNIQYPVIQAPMFGVTTPEMVAAAAGTGCLGSLPLGDLPSEKCRDAIRAAKKLSSQAFAVNLFVNEIPEITESLKLKYAKTKLHIEQLARKHGLEIQLPNLEEISIPRYQDQAGIIISEGCKIVSFTFGNLDTSTIKKFKDNNTLLIGTCTSVNEALILEQSGIDVVCVQGIEAGGHRGSFQQGDIPQIGGLSLLSQVVESVNIPVLYAGGIYNAKTLLAAKQLGAQGYQVGSLLLGSAESALKPFEKERLRNLKENEIVLTKSFTGRFARGIRNVFIDAIENTDHILPYPYQNKLTGALRRLAKTKEDPEFVSIWVGQSINPYSNDSTAHLLKTLIAETEMKIDHQKQLLR